MPTKRGFLTNDSYSQWKWVIGWKLLTQLPRPMCFGPARLPTGAAGKMPLSLFCSEDAEIGVNAMKAEMQVEILR